MRFVIDHQLPPALARWLKDRGHDAEHVFLIGLGEADDRDIWNYAASGEAVVITKDADFAERGGRERAKPQIVWLRVGNTATPELLSWLDARWMEIEAALSKGLSVIEVR